MHDIIIHYFNRRNDVEALKRQLPRSVDDSENVGASKCYADMRFAEVFHPSS